MRFTVRRLLIVTAGLALVFASMTCGLRKAENRLVVENRSGQTVAWLQISMRHAKVVTLKNLPDGGMETATFKIKGDDSFAVNGSLADGTKVVGNFGYVTSGEYGVRPRFVVREGGSVDFTDSGAEQP